MSMLMAAAGQTLQAGISSFLGKVFGANNRSAQGDCQAQLGILGSWPAVVQKYPQCAQYASGGAPAMPGAGYAVPQVMPQVSPLSVLPAPQSVALQGTMPLAYGNTSPAMALVPAGAANAATASRLLGAAGAALPMITSGARSVAALAKRNLPLLKRGLAIASGFLVAGDLVYDVSGALVGRTRRRRRMNPLNYRAAKRAARRLCAVQDLCGDIERALPHARSHAPRRHRRRRRRCR